MVWRSLQSHSKSAIIKFTFWLENGDVKTLAFARQKKAPHFCESNFVLAVVCAGNFAVRNAEFDFNSDKGSRGSIKIVERKIELAPYSIHHSPHPNVWHSIDVINLSWIKTLAQLLLNHPKNCVLCFNSHHNNRAKYRIKKCRIRNVNRVQNAINIFCHFVHLFHQ